METADGILIAHIKPSKLGPIHGNLSLFEYLSPPELELIKSFSPRLENRKGKINKAHKWCERVSIRVASQRQQLEDDKAVNNGTPCTKDPSSMGLNDQPPQITVILTRGANYLKHKKRKRNHNSLAIVLMHANLVDFE